MKEILLFSGGIDSYIAWHYLHYPQTLYVNMFHKYYKQELRTVSTLIPSTIVKELNLSEFEELDANIPMRNLYLVMLAANMGYDKIALIVQKEEMSIADRSENFFSKASTILSFLMGTPIIVYTPFKYVDKTDMVAWYIENNLPVDQLKQTWACYSPINNEPCGDCGACIRRLISFRLNKIEESWHEKALKSKCCKKYIERANEGYYSITRCNQIKEALL